MSSEISHTFEATGQSPSFQMYGPFKGALDITAGSNVVRLDEYIGGAWIPQVDSALTAIQTFTLTGGFWVEQPDDYVGVYRWNCTTFATGPVKCTARGNGFLRADVT